MAKPTFMESFFEPFRRTKPAPMDRMGGSGTAVYGGYIQSDEKSPSLQGREKFVTFSNILVNTSIAAASTRYYLGLLSKAGWKCEPNEAGGADAERYAELCEEMLYDMETPWHRIVRRAAMFKLYGFSIQEWTAKRREDGLIGMLDVEARPQFTIERWDLDTAGKVQGVMQRSPQSMAEMYLPRAKLVYFVDDALTDSPDGVGLLRHVADAARALKRYEQLEGFGFETDLRGIPIGRAPFARLHAMVKAGHLTEAERIQIETPLKEFVGNHLRNPQQGILLDSMTYASQDDAATPSSTPQWNMDILKGGATSQAECASSIERLNREVARVFGTEGLLLGSDGKGSLALSRDKSNVFATLVDGTLSDLAEVFERDLLKPIFLLNGWDWKLRPTLKPDAISYRDIEQITGALKDMAAAGAMLAPDDPAINEVRDMLGLTKADLEQLGQIAADERAAAQALVDAKLNGSTPPPEDDVSKYSAAQPRVESGARGGEWTSGGSPGAGSAPSSGDADALAATLDGIDNSASIPAQAMNQLKHDPDAKLIAEKGSSQSTKGATYVAGKEGQCHWNTAKLFKEGKIDAVVIGYARTPKGVNPPNWHQHTWGMKNGKIVETTASNKGNLHYFGVKLGKADSGKFADWAIANPPGGGVVRYGKADVVGLSLPERGDWRNFTPETED